MKVTEREKEIIYFILSRELDDEADKDNLDQFIELDNLRDKFMPSNHPRYKEKVYT